MNKQPILSASGISKSFKSGKIITSVLNDLNLDLYAGEFTLMMGPSGAGKSTCLASLSGLQAPDKGQVSINGQSLWGQRKVNVCDLRKKYCGFIFQNVNLLTPLTALEQVVFVLENTGTKSKQAHEIALNSLHEVGLEGKEHLLPPELSGGEKQRVAIARTMAMRPALIFADEPTSDLDSENGHKVVELLRKSAHDNNTMVLCVTHDERVQNVADRIIYIEDGVITNDIRPKLEAKLC
jgi:putative ABC transport system ATP-binding protein